MRLGAGSARKAMVRGKRSVAQWRRAPPRQAAFHPSPARRREWLFDVSASLQRGWGGAWARIVSTLSQGDDTASTLHAHRESSSRDVSSAVSKGPKKSRFVSVAPKVSKNTRRVSIHSYGALLRALQAGYSLGTIAEGHQPAPAS